MDIHCAFLSTWVVLKFKKNTKLVGGEKVVIITNIIIGQNTY